MTSTSHADEAFIVVTVPATFFRDHEHRDLVMYSGKDYVLGRKGHLVTVRLHQHDLYDLLSDANHYKDFCTQADDRSYFGLQQSARATLKRLKAQGYTYGYEYYRNEAGQWTYRHVGWTPTVPEPAEKYVGC